MRFSPEFIERVSEANNIVEVIGQFVELKRSGSRMAGLCPFHSEKTPSFSVSEDRQVYHCFGCKESGNIYGFLMRYKGMSFPEAVEFLAGRAGIAVPKEVRTQEQQRDQELYQDKIKLMQRMNTFAAHFYKAQMQRLSPGHPVLQYLAKRGLKAEVIEQFELGYAPDDWGALTGALQSKSAPLDVAAGLGLIKRRNTEGYFDLFRHRLMFPIKSLTGNYIGFGGRVLGDDQPKYLNSPDSPVFHKGKVFYGLDETAKYIRSADQAIVVEGYMDFLALYQAGIRNVVAALGTAFTSDHARLLKRQTKNVVMMFDGDSAGKEAAERALPILLAEGLVPKGLVLPDELDPDEFILERGAQSLKELLLQAPEMFVMLMQERFAASGNSPSERLQMIDSLAPLLQAVSDRRLRDLYIEWLSDLFGTERIWAKRALLEALRSLAQASVKSPTTGPSPSAALQAAAAPQSQTIDISQGISEVIRLTKPPPVELELLTVALMKESYFKEVIASGICQDLSSEGIREIFRRTEELYGQMPSKFDSLSALLVSEVEPPSMVTMHLEKPFVDLPELGARKLISDCIRKIRENHLRVKSRELAAHLKGQSFAEQKEKLEQIMNIQRDRHSLNREPES